MIKKGDTVRVDFNGSQLTAIFRGRVEYIPNNVGDSWQFFDFAQQTDVYISEGCTITKLKDE